MILSAIKNLERSLSILHDMPNNIEKQRVNTLAALNDIFEDFYDQCSKEDKATLKRVSALKKDVLAQMEEFCNTICEGVKEDVRIVEE